MKFNLILKIKIILKTKIIQFNMLPDHFSPS